jgi:hypothetical protein
MGPPYALGDSGTCSSARQVPGHSAICCSAGPPRLGSRLPPPEFSIRMPEPAIVSDIDIDEVSSS